MTPNATNEPAGVRAVIADQAGSHRARLAAAPKPTGYPTAVWLCASLLASQLAFGAETGMRVWVINDSVRVDPIRNRPFEDNPGLFPDGIRPGYKEANLIWDAAARRITLKAARNETVAFQIVIERTGEKLTDVKVTPAGLTGPQGAKIPLENLDMFRQWYVHVKRTSGKAICSLGAGWYPDALLPCLRWRGNLYPHMLVMPFDLPDPLNNVGEEQKSQAVWIDVYVPKSRQAAPPGKYTAPITISSDQGETQLTLELQVWDFALPEESHLKPSIHTNTEINTFSEAMELKYYQLLRKHRLAMYPLGYAPGLKVSGTRVEIDWSQYDARLAKYLDGSAFTRQYGYDGPGYGLPIEYLVLPFDAWAVNLYKRSQDASMAKEAKFYAPWPVAMPRQGPTPEYRAIWKNAFQAYQAHFDQHPTWNKTRLLVFLLSLDEAYDDLAIERILYFGQLLKEAGTRRLEYRVDGGYPKETLERLKKVLNVIITGTEEWDVAFMDEIKKHGVDPWFYNNAASLIDGDGLNGRAQSWAAWILHASSWSRWELDWNSLRAWQEPVTLRSSYGERNGAGMLVYRGETMGLDEPAASTRLKGIRRGSQDYEYFWLLSRAQGSRKMVDEALKTVLHDSIITSNADLGAPRMWVHDADQWDRLRVKFGDAIDKMSEAHAEAVK
ncbi:MAG: hypothetical protein ABSF26_11600 [Thermoguttaceae bacterium]|jgi:hypothetical protein